MLKQNDLPGVRQVVVILLNIARLSHLQIFGRRICQDQLFSVSFISVFSMYKENNYFLKIKENVIFFS